ncbi:putative nuclease HARBI1 [Diabrotica virgifera virgifera]|uniref:Nuclease HARBI1 n=1 Tax=Diabrotica virgifera virgifera TaxID=50390 RepID=A0A6P7G0Y6_DIAVI|nr:putative nuclease HARBI1 [Diabrotica virgifera virgifera]XP_050497696.1 putative nuclease HARBI1 [Diabrotica virgifera virgifera]XP_050512340.1 putative nuclease HARBI1 [Diabrotica virgifera virgifera]
MDLNNMLYWNDLMLNDILEAVEDLQIGRDVLQPTDPFLLSDRKFVQVFRLSKGMVQELVEMVSPFMLPQSRGSALSITTRVLAALRFYASGSHQEITGTNHYISISQASTSRAIVEVTNALNRPEILNHKVKFPRTQHEREALRTRFFDLYGFPGILGIIDCTHVAIVAPKDPNHPEHIYVNRKNYHSLNVQLVCDHDLKILNVNSRFPGSSHDAFIWAQSPISTYMENCYRRNPANVFFLLGDSGYPTRPWLLTPLPNPVNPGEQLFNDRLCSIRSLIERCNGVLKNRFRCLLRYRTMHYHPTLSGKIVNACCILHNMCIENNVPIPEELHPVEPDYGMYAAGNVVNIRPTANPDLAAARRLQQNIINNHFNIQ